MFLLLGLPQLSSLSLPLPDMWPSVSPAAFVVDIHRLPTPNRQFLCQQILLLRLITKLHILIMTNPSALGIMDTTVLIWLQPRVRMMSVSSCTDAVCTQIYLLSVLLCLLLPSLAILLVMFSCINSQWAWLTIDYIIIMHHKTLRSLLGVLHTQWRVKNSS